MLYPNWNDVIVVLKDHYSSHESRNSRSALITAYWVTSGRQIIEYRDIGLTAKPGRMKFFLKHIIFIGEECYGHWFANVEWFYPLTDDLKYKFEKPMEILSRLILNNSEEHLLYQYFVYCQNLFMLHLNTGVKN